MIGRIIRFLFSPVGMVLFALLIGGAYQAADSRGWRTNMSVLSGMPPAGTALADAVTRAGTYGALYIGYVIIAPILLIAAALQLMVGGVRRALVRRDAVGESEPPFA